MHLAVDDLPPLGLSFFRLTAAGFVATSLMTIVIYLGPAFGLANLDIAGMLGALLSGSPPGMYTDVWWAGMLWHFLNGVLLFPLLFTYTIGKGQSENRITKGALWGVSLWLLAQAVLMPMVGGGFFSRFTLNPSLVVLGSWVAHLIYGVSFGALLRAHSRHVLELRLDRAA